MLLSISQETKVRECVLDKLLKNAGRLSYANEYVHLLFTTMTCIVKVLSDMVADAMRNRKGDALTAMITFIEMLDKFFDCLNVRNLTSGQKEKNLFKSPY